MAYYHPYSYTYSPSSGWEYGIQVCPWYRSSPPSRHEHLVSSQAGPSAPTYTSYTEESSLFGSPIHADVSPRVMSDVWFSRIYTQIQPYTIPISRYSTLAGAVTPAHPTQQAGGVQPLGLAPQQVQRQLVQPAPFTLTGPAPSQSAQPARIQPRQPVNPQLVAPPHQGVPIQPAVPQPAPRYVTPPIIFLRFAID